MSDVKQVVMLDVVFDQFVAWADSRGWDVFRMPIDDEGIPTYGISPRNFREVSRG